MPSKIRQLFVTRHWVTQFDDRAALIANLDLPAVKHSLTAPASVSRTKTQGIISFLRMKFIKGDSFREYAQNIIFKMKHYVELQFTQILKRKLKNS